MKPLLSVVVLCLLVACHAVPENIEQVKQLPQSKEPVVEAEESAPQARKERCTTCGVGGGFNINLKAPNVLSQLQNLPGGEVHTQQSFESCSSDKGCAGLKVKDGRVVERFGNVDAFKAAAAADSGNEFTFHAAGNLANVFEGGVPGNGPFWWMNENSPFKASAAGGSGNFEKFSKSSSSFTSSGGAGNSGATGSGASFSGSVDLAANPFLNGEFSKLAGGFAAGQDKPGFQSSSFESSSFSSSSKGDVDLSKNPFLNGGFNKGQGFQAQGGFSANSGASGTTGAGFGGNQNFGSSGSQSSYSSGSKFSSGGYTGSSPSPFTASTAGSNVNLIQNSQKTNEFDFEQQQQTQQNIDEVFQGTGNVHAHEHSGGELQQTCAGQGYVCVHKAQCNNGVVNTNGAGLLQAKTKKQYCNIKTEICCRIEISTLTGAGGLQGSLGVGSATFQGQGNQGSGLFVQGSQGSASFGQSGAAGNGVSGSGIAGQGQAGSFGSSSSSFESSSSFGSSSKGVNGQGTQFGAQGNNAQGFGAAGSNANGFNAQGSFGAGSTTGSGFNAFGTGVNRGVTVESSSSTFESNRGTQGFQGSRGNAAGFDNTRGSASGNFGGSKFGASGTFGTGNFGSNGVAGQSGTGSTVYKQTSQTNFIETDSFSAGSENAGVYRPGTSGLKPGVPYLPPVDASSSGSSISSTATFGTTNRPFVTPRPYVPPVVSTSAPGYLPPEVPEQTINTETRVPKPTYTDGGIILDQNRQPNRKPVVPVVNELPSGCAAALKCTPIEYCTAEGVISNTTVVLTREQDAYRVPLTDCKNLETGQVGKCCRDPYYTDPWPTNQLGKWVQGVFGGNDGKYTPDSRGSGSINRPSVTARPPGGNEFLPNNLRTPKPTLPPFGPNQVTPGFPATSVTQAYGQKGQFEVTEQKRFGQGGQGQYSVGGQGQIGIAGQGAQGQNFGQSQFATSQFSTGSVQLDANQGQRGQGQVVSQGQGQVVSQGQGQFVQQGQGQYSQGGRGQFGVGGLGQVEQGAQGQYSQTSQTQKGFGQAVITGQGQSVSQGFGTGVKQGSGFSVSQGSGFSVENEFSESVMRVFLSQYNAGGTCGVLNGQKPYGNRNENEVDFAEIPWQAMILLQTNRSLLCGGVITRPDVVITSASCVDGLEAKNVLIKGGEWKLGIDEEPLPFQIVQVKNILRHPFYKRGSYHNDAAILVLAENLRFAKNIFPICLPRAGETLDAFYNGAGECVVTGWGKQVLQAHLAGAIMHSLNVSLINPGECQSKLQSDYPHLLQQYDQDSCACAVPTNPANNICRVDIGSALACTTDSQHFVLRGIYSWDSGCQLGNQLAAFYKFDLEWYEWAIGLIESARFAQFNSGAQIRGQNNRLTSQVKGSQSSGVRGSGVSGSGFGVGGGFGVKGGLGGKGQVGFGAQGSQFGGQFSSGFSQYSSSSASSSEGYGAEVKGPVKSFSASYSEKKVFQSEPKIITYTTKPEIVTFTTKPEYFTFTTKPKIVTYTTKPQIITYETSGSGNNPQYIAPGVTFNPSFGDVVGSHTHNAQCKCEGKK